MLVLIFAFLLHSGKCFWLVSGVVYINPDVGYRSVISTFPWARIYLQEQTIIGLKLKCVCVCVSVGLSVNVKLCVTLNVCVLSPG